MCAVFTFDLSGGKSAPPRGAHLCLRAPLTVSGVEGRGSPAVHHQQRGLQAV